MAMPIENENIQSTKQCKLIYCSKSASRSTRSFIFCKDKAVFVLREKLETEITFAFVAAQCTIVIVSCHTPDRLPSVHINVKVRILIVLALIITLRFYFLIFVSYENNEHTTIVLLHFTLLHNWRIIFPLIFSVISTTKIFFYFRRARTPRY